MSMTKKMSKQTREKINVKQIIRQVEVKSISYNYLYEIISLDDNPYRYEVLKGSKLKGYIDLDLKFKNKERLDERNALIKEIIDKLGSRKYYLFDSSGYDKRMKIWKISFRIIFPDIYFNQGSDMVGFVNSFNLPNLDKTVYKDDHKMQLMRLPYCSKEGDDRFLKKVDISKPDYPLIPISKIKRREYKEYILTNINNCEKYIYPTSTIPEECEFSEPDCESEDDMVLPPNYGEARENNLEDRVDVQDIGLKKHIDLIEDKFRKFMPKTKIVEIVPSEKGNTQIIMLGEPKDKCPLCKRQHKNNRNYILYFKDTGVYHLKCHDEDSADEYKLLYKPPAIRRKKKKVNRPKISVKNNEDESDLYNELYELFYSPVCEGGLDEASLADIFVKYNKDDIKIVNEKGDGYQWCKEQNNWRKLNGKSMMTLIPELFEQPIKKILENIQKTYDECKDDFADYHYMIKKNLQKTYKQIRSCAVMKNIYQIISSSTKVLYTEKDIFDIDPNLFGFDNGVYDLENNEFRAKKKTDFITMSAGYDYRKPTDEEREVWNEYINKVMPIEDERKLLIKILSSCLRGEVIQNLFFFIGVGANSKDTLVTIILKNLLGRDYYYQGPSCLLTHTIKMGPTPELSNMNKKRLVVITEPDENQTIKCSSIKLLSGSTELGFRGLYDGKCQIFINATFICLLNKIPPAKGVDKATKRRLLGIPFRAQFLKEERYVEEIEAGTENCHKVDSYFNSNAFFSLVKFALFDDMVNSYQNLKEDNYIIQNVPKTVQDITDKYIEDCDELVQWFNECYKLTDNKEDYIKFIDIWNKFKSSSLYLNMSSYERRKITKKKMISDISTNPTLGKYFIKRRKMRNKDCKNIMIKHVINNDDSEYESESDLEV